MSSPIELPISEERDWICKETSFFLRRYFQDFLNPNLGRQQSHRSPRKKLLLAVIASAKRKSLRAKYAFVLQRAPFASVSVILLNDKQMREINQKHRNRDQTTDVLSFPCWSGRRDLQSVPAGMPFHLGDVLISMETCNQLAWMRKNSILLEFRCLLVHGLLHLVGCDHEKGLWERKKMEFWERLLLKARKENDSI